MIGLLCLVLLGAGPEQSSALTEGQPAPFAGVLVPERRLFPLLEAELAATRCRAELRLVTVENDTLEALMRERAPKPVPWYETAHARFVGGFVSGAAVTVVVLTVTARVLAP